MDRRMHFLQLSCAEKPGYENTGPRGHAHEKTDQHIDQRRTGSHRSQRLMADKVADDNRVDRVVEQLEQIPQQ